MDSGMWVLGLAIIPFICLATYIVIIRKKFECSSTKIAIIIIISILFLTSILIIKTNTLSIFFESFSYSNVENLMYEIEEKSDNKYDIFIYDKKGYYYYAKKQSVNNEFESEIYLIKTSKNKVPGLNIDLLNSRISKVYMTDYNGNKVLIWNYDDYN